VGYGRGVRSYFRLHPADDDPRRLLDPENQTSEPWGGTIYGRCDKCGGEGETEHHDGRMDECPACQGSGEIDDSCRDGVSVFPDVDALYRYMRAREADIDGSLLVELEGEPSADDDFDADEGALLIRPTRIVSVTMA
jgi:DnaJ-class molecular chaperone